MTKTKERLELKNCGDRYGGTARRVRRVDRTVSECSGSISSLSKYHLSFLVLYNKDMKIESEKAQVRISSLSKYQSLIYCFA